MNTTPENRQLPPPALSNRADTDQYALVVVDAQVGFDDPCWGPRNNPDCDADIQRLVEAWQHRQAPLVYVRHDSDEPDSPLHPDKDSNRLKPYLRANPNVLVTKRVNSAFHGTPDLHAWLTAAGISGIVVCGITTNHCCETTARVGGNLGYQVLFALDATHTFDRPAPDGTMLSAHQLALTTAANLHGEFATVVSTDQLLADRRRNAAPELVAAHRHVNGRETGDLPGAKPARHREG